MGNPDEVKKPKRLKYILSVLFMIVLLVATVFFLMTKYNFKDVMRALGEVNAAWILLSIPCVFIYILFEGLAMKIILHSMGLNVSVKDNFVYSAVDYFFCAVTPSATGGQPMVLYYMKKDKLPVAESSLVLMINTAMFKIVLLTLSVIAVSVYPQFVFSDFGLGPTVPILFFLGMAVNVFLVVMCFLGAFKRNWIEALGKQIIRLGIRMHIIKHPLKTLRTFIQKMDDYERGAELIRYHKKHFALALLSNFIQRISLFAVGYFVYLAFYYTYPGLEAGNFLKLVAVQVIIALCVDSLPLPGGMGISEALYSAILGLVYIPDIVGGPEGVASALLLTRAAAFYIPVLVTMIIWLIRHIRATLVRRN